VHRFLFAILVVFVCLDAHGQSSLPRCPNNTSLKWTNCTGTFSSPDGVKYSGEWRDDMRDGQGTSTSPNGDKYDGEWRDDMRNGQGTATLHDGKRYVGEWLNDKRHGSGASIFPNGEKYVGEYRDDKRNGPGIVYGPNGTVRLSGLWADGGLVQSYAIDPIRRPFKDSASTGNSSRAEQDQLAVVRDAAHQRRPTVQDQANAASSPPSTSFERVTPTIEANLPANSNVSAPNLRRVALVIGNARYNNAPVLTNPPADAASVSAALREAGFQTVTVKTDLSQQATLTALREFAALADAADWAVVYYANGIPSLANREALRRHHAPV